MLCYLVCIYKSLCFVGTILSGTVLSGNILIFGTVLSITRLKGELKEPFTQNLSPNSEITSDSHPTSLWTATQPTSSNVNIV